jgi:hypothetical protein
MSQKSKFGSIKLYTLMVNNLPEVTGSLLLFRFKWARLRFGFGCSRYLFDRGVMNEFRSRLYIQCKLDTSQQNVDIRFLT